MYENTNEHEIRKRVRHYGIIHALRSEEMTDMHGSPGSNWTAFVY